MVVAIGAVEEDVLFDFDFFCGEAETRFLFFGGIESPFKTEQLMAHPLLYLF